LGIWQKYGEAVRGLGGIAAAIAFTPTPPPSTPASASASSGARGVRGRRSSKATGTGAAAAAAASGVSMSAGGDTVGLVGADGQSMALLLERHNVEALASAVQRLALLANQAGSPTKQVAGDGGGGGGGGGGDRKEGKEDGGRDGDAQGNQNEDRCGGDGRMGRNEQEEGQEQAQVSQLRGQLEKTQRELERTQAELDKQKQLFSRAMTNAAALEMDIKKLQETCRLDKASYVASFSSPFLPCSCSLLLQPGPITWRTQTQTSTQTSVRLFDILASITSNHIFKFSTLDGSS
jgi:hypothetical protein